MHIRMHELIRNGDGIAVEEYDFVVIFNTPGDAFDWLLKEGIYEYQPRENIFDIVYTNEDTSKVERTARVARDTTDEDWRRLFEEFEDV